MASPSGKCSGNSVSSRQLPLLVVVNKKIIDHSRVLKDQDDADSLHRLGQAMKVGSRGEEGLVGREESLRSPIREDRIPEEKLWNRIR